MAHSYWSMALRHAVAKTLLCFHTYCTFMSIEESSTAACLLDYYVLLCIRSFVRGCTYSILVQSEIYYYSFFIQECRKSGRVLPTGGWRWSLPPPPPTTTQQTPTIAPMFLPPLYILASVLLWKVNSLLTDKHIVHMVTWRHIRIQSI